MPTLTNTRFGAVDFDENDVLTLTDGIIGFPSCTRYVLLCHNEEGNFRWLQSLDSPELALLVTDPCNFVAGYEVALGETFASAMRIDGSTPTLLLTTVTIPRGRPQEMTINLAGPIVINVETRIGRQFVIDDEAYTIKHRVFPDAAEMRDVAA